MSDDEIANLIVVKIASSITFCAQAMSKTVRTDVGILFFEIQVELMKFAAPLKNLMKEDGFVYRQNTARRVDLSKVNPADWSKDKDGEEIRKKGIKILTFIWDISTYRLA